MSIMSFSDTNKFPPVAAPNRYTDLGIIQGKRK